MKAIVLLVGFAAAGLIPVLAAETTDYRNDVLPIMKERCWKCHSNENDVKGNLALDDLEEVRTYQIGEFNIIRPGNPEESGFLERLLLDSSHTDFMPRKAEPLPKEELGVIEKWIREGAVIDREKITDEEKARLAEAGISVGSDASAMRDEFLQWTNSEGKSIEARFLSLGENGVDLLLRNGRRYSVPLEKLDEESVALAKRLAGKS